MPRFFFDFHDSRAPSELDEIGVALDSLADAKRQATVTLADHGAEVVDEYQDRDLRVVVRSDSWPMAVVTLRIRTNDLTEKA